MRGLTLVEVLITMALFLLTVGVVASLASEYGSLMRFSSESEQSAEAGRLALARLRGEASQATDFVTPDPASITFPQLSPASELVFFRLDPAAARRSPADTRRLPTPPYPATAFEPFASADLMRVRYYVSGGDLWRDVTRGGSTTTSRLAGGVTGLSVRFPSQRLLECTVAVDKRGVVVPLKAEIFLTREVLQ